MGIGHEFQGASGKHFSFSLMAAPDPNIMPSQGGLIAIVSGDPERPVFMGGVAGLRDWFKNLHLWTKAAKLPAPLSWYIYPDEDAASRINILNDLLARYEPPLNGS
jgi:hypothetical protein